MKVIFKIPGVGNLPIEMSKGTSFDDACNATEKTLRLNKDKVDGATVESIKRKAVIYMNGDETVKETIR